LPVKKNYALPVQGVYKDFCLFMEYELLYEKNKWFYFYVPPGHICRFRVNCERWAKGIFDKNKFLEKLQSN